MGTNYIAINHTSPFLDSNTMPGYNSAWHFKKSASIENECYGDEDYEVFTLYTGPDSETNVHFYRWQIEHGNFEFTYEELNEYVGKLNAHTRDEGHFFVKKNLPQETDLEFFKSRYSFGLLARQRVDTVYHSNPEIGRAIGKESNQVNNTYPWQIQQDQGAAQPQASDAFLRPSILPIGLLRSSPRLQRGGYGMEYDIGSPGSNNWHFRRVKSYDANPKLDIFSFFRNYPESNRTERYDTAIQFYRWQIDNEDFFLYC